ncbi:GPI inositol-deacylase [Labilibaculum sp. DW002]|uniref:GPI inositol-deacylase n=1 Tax=Paralabilibaculum antarcticum TaxID=2912572 RepID=A0ABT5VS03_9BACT|nr:MULTISPECIES: alpha/beta hydrolase [unclassified Labilibaculum]MBI9056360.1 alpha/beta hydrolase [Labilibaculum sp.]MDE5418205.1 GPI inositol-deacylase [Labilibaculum sp. DW002]
MANVIIEIHGLGNKPPKNLLERWWERAMIEGLKSNNYKANLPKYEMVYWADILHDQPLNQFEKNEDSPYYLDEIYVRRPKLFVRENHDTRKKVVNFVNRQLNKFLLNEDFSLNYSFITDVILGNYFQDLQTYYQEESESNEESANKIKESIRLRLLKVLEKYKGDDIMLIAHSMGSIIAFDVLSFLANHIQIHTFVTIGSPLGLPIVVSKFADEQRVRNNGGTLIATPPNVKSWYNFADILDKVALNYELGDDFKENRFGVKPIDYLVENNYQINKISNPHKSYGYLRTPEFAQVLNNFILSERLTLKQKFNRKAIVFVKRTKLKVSIQRRKVQTWFRKRR